MLKFFQHFKAVFKPAGAENRGRGRQSILSKAIKAIKPIKATKAKKAIKPKKATKAKKAIKAIKAIKPTKKIIVKKKIVLNSVLVKELVLKELNLMKQGESFKKDRWRTLAYNKAIRAIKDYNGTFKSSKDVAHLKGVGEKILKKIDEIISTGKLKAANTVRKDKTIGAIEILSNIVAVGPVKAKELVEKHGIKSIKQLREKKNQALLNDKQLMGLKYYEDLLEKIPRNEMDKHKKVIEDVAKKLDSTMEVSVVGSYRRGVSRSGDIDILIRHPKDKNMLKPLVETLMKKGYLQDNLSYGTKKYSGICFLGKDYKSRRIDLLFTTKKEYPFALFYFTGSGSFNVEIRKKATKMGYKLNEYGIKKLKEKEYMSNIKTEQEIFNILKVDYLQPKDRYPMNIKAL